MKLVIVSGLSGSGKSIALATLEDKGYYCIDNLPVFLLENFLEEARKPHNRYQKVAVSIDSRNQANTVQLFPGLLETIRKLDIEFTTLYLQAEQFVLINRFRETRRRHPLSHNDLSLSDAIEEEQRLMNPIANYADIIIDTTHMNIHQIRQEINNRIEKGISQGCTVRLESFGFKYGIPADADLVFDARCLPNPYWQTNLCEKTGQDIEVKNFLKSSPEVSQMIEDIFKLLQRWLPLFEKENRRYLNVAVGCTGGQHRSVYVIEEVAVQLRTDNNKTLIRHRELSKQ
ncbi:MAG: RNase adapter RapZ [Gammaproteobacteria bacterium]|nr:RNase adapter RapZ [Gammaproteobacteria bacterium]